jgi:predicted DCC family thiol-disulfide oxidoreductase YuxK
MDTLDLTETVIVYDGDCPFCSRYVTLMRLREAIGPVVLKNAREGGPLIEELTRRGYDLDEGMVLIHAGEIFHGSECMARLGLLSTPSTTFNPAILNFNPESAESGDTIPNVSST